MRVEPREQGAGFEFVDEGQGSTVPKEYILPIHKGIKEALDNGVVAGYPMVDVRATVLTVPTTKSTRQKQPLKLPVPWLFKRLQAGWSDSS